MRTRRADENRNNEVTFNNGKEKLKVDVYFAALDKLNCELRTRCSTYESLVEKFNFLLNIGKDPNPNNPDNIIEEAEKFRQFYTVDIEETFPQECVHFRSYIRNTVEAGGGTAVTSAHTLLKFFHEHNLQETFPNVNIALKIFLTMAVCNCSAERSFSCLKRIKNYLRSTIGQDRLNALAVLCIEAELTSAIDFGDIIDDFAKQKARKKIL